MVHSSPHVNQTLPQIIHIQHFCVVDSLLNVEHVVNWSWLFGDHKSDVMNARQFHSGPAHDISSDISLQYRGV